MKARFNAYDAELMEAPSRQKGYCVVCGAMNVTSHHVVPRARGGHKGPQLHLCGSGSTGHHGMAEDKKLHFRYNSRWEYAIFREPTKYQTALDFGEWLPCI